MKESKDIHNVLCELSKDSESAFREIFHLFSDKVYSFAYKLTRERVAAEEIVQEVFMKVWINRSTINTVENLSSYLFVMSRNLVLNSVKRKALEEKAKAEFILEAPRAKCEPEEAIIAQDYERIVAETIDHLPPQQRLVYSMCHNEGLHYDEVAERLKISRLTVKTHMHQALKTIKAQVTSLVQLILLFVLAGL